MRAAQEAANRDQARSSPGEHVSLGSRFAHPASALYTVAWVIFPGPAQRGGLITAAPET
jgi:hypothetical protein